MKLTKILIGCGSNLKNPFIQLSKTLNLLSVQNYITLQRISPLYKTEPWGFKNQSDYLNCVISIKSKVNAHSLLRRLLKIEKKLGRIRSFKNAPRIIDLDLLVYKQEKKHINLVPQLSLPHPQIVHRKFVIQPLLDLGFDIKIPGKKTLRHYLKLTNNQRIKKIRKEVRLSQSL